MNSRIRRTATALLAAIGVTLAPLSAADEAATEVQLSLFLRTAVALGDAKEEPRTLFAREALAELYTVYSAEADLARRQNPQAQPSAKLRSWSTAVDRYAEQLLLLLEDLEQGFPVDVSTRRDSVVVVSVADRRVMLTHPRVGQQRPYEAHVLEVFCAQTDCAELTDVEVDSTKEQLYHGQVKPEWHFAEGGASCHHDGASLRFTPAVGLPRLRRLCRGFFQELEDLQRELAWQQVLQAQIDWESLSIRATPGKTQHFIVLNRSGDTVLSELPLLYANAALLPEMAGWLRDRSAGGDEAVLELDGNRLLTMQAE